MRRRDLLTTLVSTLRGESSTSSVDLTSCSTHSGEAGPRRRVRPGDAASRPRYLDASEVGPKSFFRVGKPSRSVLSGGPVGPSEAGPKSFFRLGKPSRSVLSGGPVGPVGSVLHCPRPLAFPVGPLGPPRRFRPTLPEASRSTPRNEGLRVGPSERGSSGRTLGPAPGPRSRAASPAKASEGCPPGSLSAPRVR